MPPPLLISFLFALDTEQGHLFEYNKAVGQACRLIGWEHAAAVRAAARVSERPPGWSFCLGSRKTLFAGGPALRVEKLLRLLFSLVAYLRRAAQEPRPVILFLEWFDMVHLVPFCLALALTPGRRRLWVWIVHRLVTPPGPGRRRLQWVHAVLRRLVGGDRVVLLSDSALVAEAIAGPFGGPVHLLPIPHTQAQAPAARRPELDGRLVCWLPGRAIPEKGLAHVAALAAQSGPEASRLSLVVSASARLAGRPDGPAILHVPDVLPRAEYEGWLQAADVVLLPYLPELYGERTSGGFAEAIGAGKLPVVTDGTWMAHELRRYDLPELILDWAAPDLAGQLLRLAGDPTVRARLDQMRADYQRFHSLAGYSQTLRQVWSAVSQAEG